MGGKDDPNLDGDFVTLYEIKQKRNEERKKQAESQKLQEESLLEDNLLETDQGAEEKGNGDAKNGNTTQQDNVKAIYSRMIEAIGRDDVTMLRMLTDDVKKLGIPLGHDSLCHEMTKETILHTALKLGRIESAKSLIEFTAVDLLTQDFEVIVKNHPSLKSTLHLLSELGHLGLIQLLLHRIPQETRKMYLSKSVLMEIAGQRPRHLEAIHIAALEGHTKIVEYFVSLGIDVNTVNNKNDTPVLWAARNNCIDTVRRLIKLGANLNHQNDKGSTPLYWACRYGQIEMVRVLIIEGKADIHQQRKLGLVSPIVLGSAYGFVEIVKELIIHGANVNLQIQGGVSPLHYAAQQGNVDTIKLLLYHGAVVDIENDFGDTPMLLAAKENEIAALKILASHGANLDQRNNDGKTVWNYAIESKHNLLLITVVTHFKKQKRMTSGKIVFPVGKSPLHLAAAKGDISKLQCLLDLGTDPTAVDEGGNTFYHIAARQNSKEVLNTFVSKVEVNAQNSDGDTSLHLAAYNGNLDAIKIILEKAKVDVKNNNTETALHAACRSPLTSSEVIKVIVDTIIQKHSWSLVDAPDRYGNTALHIAAKAGRVDIMEHLKQLSPQMTNSFGDSPLMSAAKSAQTDVLAVMLDTFKENLSINQQNNSGESLLYVAVRQGLADMVELLILAGADLSLKDHNGNTPLHILAQQTVRNRDNLINLMETANMIQAYVVRWWCVRHDKHMPDHTSDDYEYYLREAYVYLIREMSNNEGLSVLQYCAKYNAIDFFNKLVHTNDVFVFKDTNAVEFDITNLTPDTMAQKLTQKGKEKLEKYPSHSTSKSSVAPLVSSEEPDDLASVHVDDSMAVSCLELIVRSDNIQVANEMLNISPIEQIVKDYWNAYQWIYGFIMVLHIMYMSLLSVYAIPSSVQIRGALNATLVSRQNGPSAFPFLLFLIWPLMMFAFEVYYIIIRVTRWVKGRDKGKGTPVRFQGVRGKFRLVWNVVWGNLTLISCLIFIILVIVWYALYVRDSVYQIYILATALIMGWLFTIVFTSGFEAVHSYSIMLKQIVIRDITRFLFIYLFILLGFSFAFHAMFSVATDLTGQYPSIWYVMFAVFNMMIGMGEIFDDNFDDYYSSIGLTSASVYVKLVYLFYIILTTIILLNLLIAMMTDSYSAVKAKEGTNWRVGSIRLALQIEKSIPALSLLKTKRYPVRKDLKHQRFLMKIPMKEVLINRTDNKSEIIKMMNRLEKELMYMRSTMTDLVDKVDIVSDRVDALASKSEGTEGAAVNKFVKALRRRATGGLPNAGMSLLRQKSFLSYK